MTNTGSFMLDINDTVAIETLKQLRAECRLSPANDAVALEVICTPVGKLTVPQIEFARRMAGMPTRPYQIHDDAKLGGAQ